MIVFLTGNVIEKQPARCVLDVGGIGYEILIPISTYDRLPKTGENCRILIYEHIREDQHTLFGFMSGKERKMFILLLSISGVGPKLALSALSGMTVRELKIAIVDGDVKRISSISGIGKKMAERIVVELRHKINTVEALATDGDADNITDGRLRDAVLALVALGYKQEVAYKKVTEVLANTLDKDLSIEDIIKHSLNK